MNWLPFTRQSQIKRNTVVYKRINASVNTPDYIDRLLLQNSDIHQRETRYSNTNLMCPRFTRKTEGGRTFTVDPPLNGTVLIWTLGTKIQWLASNTIYISYT